ncbi:hypothetical protein DVH24_011092 [Malus domestica]|uniref:DUF7788 domain-containing protein n=1 Tax=Malus domestica TaxID=3750 RepID=A0A498JUZ9_MALDO|nr:hypothetical protein DVH24_011092 [Malus domestica]
MKVLLRDVGAGKSSLVLRFVKEQFIEFQIAAGRFGDVDVDRLFIRVSELGLSQTLIKSQDWMADFGKVFDVILEEAVNANLKPDKMVKKVLALTTYKHLLTGNNFSFWGETKMSPFLLLVSATTTSPKLSFFEF